MNQPAKINRPQGELGDYFERAYPGMGPFDPSSLTHVDLASLAYDEEKRRWREAREDRRHSARHRRYRCASLLNPCATGRFQS